MRFVQENKERGIFMEKKEEKVEKTKKVEEVNTQKVEEPKFNKVSGKDLKKEIKMDTVETKKADKNNKKENKENKDEKSNKVVGYWVGGIVLLLVVLAIVTALILLPATPEKTVDGMLNSLKNADFESINKYINYDEAGNQSEFLEDSQIDEEAQSLLFNKLSWKILNITKETDKASVEIEITNKDFEQIISNYTQEALKIAFSGESFTEEEQNNKLKEQLKNEQIETKTVNTTIQLVKQEREWKVQANEDLLKALLPGLQEAMDYLNAIING